MKRIITVLISISMSSLLMSGCVLTSTYNKFVAESKKADAILFCESRNDAYEDLMNSDEMDPTRRDEPTGTRRDLALCDQEFIDNFGSFAKACRDGMTACIDDVVAPVYTGQQCRACYLDCQSTGAWPTAGAGSCPPLP